MTRESVVAALLWAWVVATLAVYVFQFRGLIGAALRTLGLA